MTRSQSRTNKSNSKVARGRTTGKKPGGELRIIAGQWRGRKLQFPDAEGLRPTPERVRETLFNWLMHDIPGAVCADLFAGTGALGLEALSRSAKQVLFFEKQPQVAKALQENLARLDKRAETQKNLDVNTEPQHGSERAKVFTGDVLQQLAQVKDVDLIFLDPPYHTGLLQQAINALPEQKSRCLIYLEYAADEPVVNTPKHWQQLKQKKAGQVVYALYQVS